MKIGVVEDEERIASFLRKGLAAHGYAVEWAKTGQEGALPAPDGPKGAKDESSLNVR